MISRRGSGRGQRGLGCGVRLFSGFPGGVAVCRSGGVSLATGFLLGVAVGVRVVLLAELG